MTPPQNALRLTVPAPPLDRSMLSVVVPVYNEEDAGGEPRDRGDFRPRGAARDFQADGGFPRDQLAAERPAAAVVVLIPVYNDWRSLQMLLPRLDDVCARRGRVVEVLVVDDGSTIEPEFAGDQAAFRSLARVDALTLRRNLGHQRAIAVGLAYIEDCLDARAVVVMDGDGEDDPADVPRLLDRLEAEGGRRIVFAERTKRSESRAFRMFYGLYKLAHRSLTGERVRVGNFSAIPARRLKSLVVVTELWNHYAAAVRRSKQPYCTIPTERGRRLQGRSTMNFVALVAHGLSAISVHGDVVGVRLLVASALLAAFAVAGVAGAVAIRLATSWAVPGWATFTVGLLLVLLFQATTAAFVFSFMVLGARNGSTFLPRRDYTHFIGGLHAITGWGGPPAPLPAPARQTLAAEL